MKGIESLKKYYAILTDNGTSDIYDDDTLAYVFPIEVVEPEKIKIDETNLEQYYDTTEFVGTPKIEHIIVDYSYRGKEVYLQRFIKDADNKTIETYEYYIERTSEFTGESLGCYYKCIVCDNNTPDDYSDDTIARVFIHEEE